MAVATINKVSLRRGIGKQLPLYEQIRRDLRVKITEANLKNGDRLPSIYALAREMNVTYHTVRSALSLLEQDGVIKYEANRGATIFFADENEKVAARPEKAVAMTFVRWQGDAFCLEVSEGIGRYAQENEIPYMVVDAHTSIEAYCRQVDACAGKEQGIIVMPEEHPDFYKAIERAVQRGVSIVFIDRVLPGMSMSSVCVDHFAGAFNATNHLLESHKKPVHYLGSVHKPSSCRDWVRGWSDAMRQHGYGGLDEYKHRLAAPVTEEEFQTFEGVALKIDVDASVELIKSCGDDKLCVFAGNDYVASGLYMAAQKLGRQIGEDVFVVGFGDMPLCGKLPVRLSSVGEKCRQVGYEGARVLHGHLCGEIKHPVHRIVSSELFIRESSIGLRNLIEV